MKAAAARSASRPASTTSATASTSTARARCASAARGRRRSSSRAGRRSPSTRSIARHGREPGDRQRRRPRRRPCGCAASSSTTLAGPRRPLVRLGRRRAAPAVELSGVGAARRAAPQRARRRAPAIDAGARRQDRPVRGRPADRGQRRRRARPRHRPRRARRPTSTPAASTRNEVLAGQRGRRSSPPAPSRPAARSTSSATRSRRAASGIVVGADATVDSNAVNRLGRARRRATGSSSPPGGVHGRARPRADHRQPRPRPLGHRDRAAHRGPHVHGQAERASPTSARGSLIEGQRRGRARRDREQRGARRRDAREGVGDRRVGIAVARGRRRPPWSATRVARVGARLGAGAACARASSSSAADDVRVSGNVVDEIGAAGGFLGIAVGIVVARPVRRRPRSPTTRRASAPSGRRRPRAAGTRCSSSPPAAGVVARRRGDGRRARRATARSSSTAAGRSPRPRAPTTPASRRTRSPAAAALPTCLVRVSGDVVAQGNQCLHDGGEELAGDPAPAARRSPPRRTASAAARRCSCSRSPENRFAARRQPRAPAAPTSAARARACRRPGSRSTRPSRDHYHWEATPCP